MEKLQQVLKNNYGIDVEYGDENAYLINDKRIEICKNQNAKSKYYTLLHEAGHVYLRSKKEFAADFPLNESRIFRRCKKHRMEVLREEFEAWRVCVDLAEENGLLMEKQILNAMRDKYMLQYIDWVINPSKYE